MISQGSCCTCSGLQLPPIIGGDPTSQSGGFLSIARCHFLRQPRQNGPSFHNFCDRRASSASETPLPFPVKRVYPLSPDDKMPVAGAVRSRPVPTVWRDIWRAGCQNNLQIQPRPFRQWPTQVRYTGTTTSERGLARMRKKHLTKQQSRDENDGGGGLDDVRWQIMMPGKPFPPSSHHQTSRLTPHHQASSSAPRSTASPAPPPSPTPT